MLGHLPFLLVDGYRQFVRAFAERFIDADRCPFDERLFRAQKRLSTLVNQSAPHYRVAEAQREVDETNMAIAANPSRRSLLLKLYLWAIEFGFMDMGTSVPKVVEAAVLSSQQELRRAISQTKIPLDRHNVNTQYDFTNPQKQYFTFRDWESLLALLFEL